MLFYAGLTLKKDKKQNYYIDPGSWLLDWLLKGNFEPMIYAKLQLRNSFIEQGYKLKNYTRYLIPSGIPAIDSSRSIEYGGGFLVSFFNTDTNIFKESKIRAFRIGLEQIKFDQRSIDEPNAYTQAFTEFFCERTTLWRKPNILRFYFKYEYRKPLYLEKPSSNPIDHYLRGSNIELFKVKPIPDETFHKSVIRWNFLIGLNYKYVEKWLNFISIPSSNFNFGLVADGAVSGLKPKQMYNNKEHLGNDPYDNFSYYGFRAIHYKMAEESTSISFFLDFGVHQFFTTSRYYTNNRITMDQAMLYLAKNGDQVDRIISFLLLSKQISQEQATMLFYANKTDTILNRIRTVGTGTPQESMFRFGVEIFTSGGFRQ